MTEATETQTNTEQQAAAKKPKAERKPAAPLSEKSAVIYLTTLLNRLPSKRTQIRVLKYLLDKATDELADETSGTPAAAKA